MSTNILSVAYDALAKILIVYFVGGGKYEYHNIPYETYDDMLHAKSQGKYFDTHIKDKYKFDKIY